MNASSTARVLRIVVSAVFAAAIPAARASAILDTSMGCTVEHGSGTCTLSQVSPAGGDPGLNWIQVAGNITSDDGFIEIFAAGDASGMISGAPIPIHWDFLVSTPTAGAGFFWRLQFGLDGPVNVAAPLEDDLDTTNREIAGEDLIVLPPGEVTGWSVDLQITNNSRGPISLNIPAGSTLDLNSPTPEPATMLLAATGALILFVARKITA